MENEDEVGSAAGELGRLKAALGTDGLVGS